MASQTCLPREIFIPKEYLNQLQCSFGLGIFNDPVALPCQHVFCRCCIEAWLIKNGTCPKCRQKYSKEELKPQWVFAKIIQSAIVQCPNTGCEWKGRFDMLDHHKLNECKLEDCCCPIGCGEKFKRSSVEEHKSKCLHRKVACKYCQSFVPLKAVADHENVCAKNVVECPKHCGIKLLAREIESHIKEECEYGEIPCKFAKTAACPFVGNKEKLEEHYAGYIEKHLEVLTQTVISLNQAIEAYEKQTMQNLPAVISQPGDKEFDVVWSTGNKKVSGSAIKAWSFFLSKQTIQGNFKARLKITDLNHSDPNGWKICLGIYNSKSFQAGNWGRYKNAWGYVLGNGNKAGTETVAYGQPFGYNDIVTIEYNQGKISFFKNGASQGLAFQDVKGPFYLAVGLSDTGHSIEIIDVIEQNT